MGDIDPAFATEPTNRKYHLRCKTKFITKDISDTNFKGEKINRQRRMVILFPQESDQATLFYNAWLPHELEKYHEVVGQMAHPVYGIARMSVHRGFDENADRPYLFMMSKGVEEILLKRPEGEPIDVTILPESNDEEADNMQDSEENYRPEE